MSADKTRDYLSCRVSILLHEEELEKLKRGLANSTCWSMSEYGRKILTGKPIVVFYRNQSLDDFMQEAIALRKDLQKMISQQENKEQLIPILEEIKICINKIFDHVRQNKTQQRH